MLGKTRYELAANQDRDGRCKAIDDAVRHRQPIRNVEYKIVNGKGEQWFF